MFVILLALIAILCLCRLVSVLKRRHNVRPKDLVASTCSLAVFLGSGHSFYHLFPLVTLFFH